MASSDAAAAGVAEAEVPGGGGHPNIYEPTYSISLRQIEITTRANFCAEIYFLFCSETVSFILQVVERLARS